MFEKKESLIKNRKIKLIKINRFKLPSVTWLYKKRFNIKLKSKYIYAAKLSFFKKRYLFINILKNFLKGSKLDWLSLKFCTINLILKFRKNTYLNFSHINGNVIKNFSCGFYYKKSLKKTYFALNSLIVASKIDFKYLYMKKWFILNIIYKYYTRKILRNLKELFETTPYNLKFINFIKSKAHNGIRKKKRRRK